MGLSLILLLGAAPLWVGLVRGAVGTHDRLLEAQRWRVAQTRLERDVRTASTGAVEGWGAVALLEATPTRFVIIRRVGESGGFEVASWEFAGASLMRRRTAVVPGRPLSWSGGFADSKTMLEGVAGGTFTYRAASAELGGAVGGQSLGRVTAIVASCRLVGAGGGRSVPVSVVAGLGR